MKITGLQWHHYRLPFRTAFTTAHGVMTAREGIIVEVMAERGISGLGEIAPLPLPGDAGLAEVTSLLPLLSADLRGMELDKVLEALPDINHLIGHTSVGTGGGGVEWWGPCACPGGGAHRVNVDRHKAPALPLHHPLSLRIFNNLIGNQHYRPSQLHATLCGLEMALLDALGKAEGRAVSALLAPHGSVSRSAVAVNTVIGVSTTDAAIAAAQEAGRKGFRCVKLKVGQPGSIREEVERVAAVRDAIGPEMHLRLDANEAWNFEEAIAFLSRCASYNIQYVEQPLKAHDLAGMRALRQSVAAQSIPIAADEALDGLESARLILENEAADVLVIKPQLAGGLRVGQQIIQEAAERGVRSVITSTLEAGVGVAAALHLAAASPSVTLECGLGTLPLLADDLLVDDLPVREGMMMVPTSPGLGVALDREALVRYPGTLKEN